MKTIQAKVSLSGKLRREKNGVLKADFAELAHPLDDRTAWGMPAFTDAAPAYTEFKAHAAWEKAREEWIDAAHASDAYQARMVEVLKSQKTEPFWFQREMCAYQDRIYYIADRDGLDLEEMSLLVKHFVLSQRQQFKRLSREIEAFENLDRLIHRDPIPESIRIFVWQRDQGKCVECGVREALEFDHIIPISEGGSSTERNVQLLCSQCNKKKGARV
jgi:hypothetical protein